MSGFVGFTSSKKKEALNKMIKEIIHRGPDGEDEYFDNNISLGYRALKINSKKYKNEFKIITSKDKNLVIVLDGNIYNYKDLKKDLENKNYLFETERSEEVVLNGYIEYKEKILNKLRGVFSFIIWNKKEKTLFGARDQFGAKPLYYTTLGKDFVFSSEIKAILKYPGVKKRMNEEALKLYLIFQYNPLNETFFKSIYKLPPAHYFYYKNGTLKIERYFDFTVDYQDKGLNKTVDNIEKTIKESIKVHTEGDFNVGCFLSSGVDSSYLTSLIKPQKTFSVGFPNDGFNETAKAQELSHYLEIENISKTIEKDEFFSILPKVQYYSEEPHANLSTVPLLFLSKMAQENGYRVLISGEGSDEFFMGYNHYEESLIFKMYKLLPQGIRRKLYEKYKDKKHFKGQTIIKRYGLPVEEGYIGEADIMSSQEANNLLTKKYQNTKTPEEFLKPLYAKYKDYDDKTKKMYIDLTTWLSGDILLKADKMTSANSIEARTPILDMEVWNLARTIPIKYKNHGTITKYAFRLAASRKIPKDWFERRKMGFLVPFVEWIKEDKYYQIVKKEFNKEYVSEFFNVSKINKLLDEHYKNIKNNGRKIYTIYSFLIWYNRYFKEEENR